MTEMKQISARRLAELEAVYYWQIDCGDLNITFQEIAGELLQAVKAERSAFKAHCDAVITGFKVIVERM
jgi:hypothetical protein